MLLENKLPLSASTNFLVQRKKSNKLKLCNAVNASFTTNSDLVKYFKMINVVVPQCLSNSSTVLKNRNTRSLVFIARYLMNSGQLSKIINCLNFSLSRTLYKDSLIYFNKVKNENLKLLTSKGVETLLVRKKYINSTDTFSNLYSKLASLKPIFHYYIYRVDKQIYKNSRGRSGKYTFIWKYLTPFKRINFIIFNLAKEIKLDYSKDLVSRVTNCFLKYLSNPKATLISRAIRFSNNYVFLGGKNNLLQNYRTIKSS